MIRDKSNAAFLREFDNLDPELRPYLKEIFEETIAACETELARRARK